MDDEIILILIKDLDGRVLQPSGADSDGFKYFATEPMF
jgi:hypothetical protein